MLFEAPNWLWVPDPKVWGTGAWQRVSVPARPSGVRDASKVIPADCEN